MIRNKFTRMILAGAVAASLLGAAGVASAASVLQIQFSGLDMIYNGRGLFDARSMNGGNVFTGDADQLVTMSFLVDGVNQGTLVHNIYADILIPGVTGIPASGGTVFSTGFAQTEGPASVARNGQYGYFDLLIGNPNSGADQGLLLDLDSAVQVNYSGNEIFVNGGGQTNGILDQALPFNLTIGTPVEFSFSLNNLQNVTTSSPDAMRGLDAVNGEYVTGFLGSGTGEVNGPTTAIPEPTTLLLVGLGLLGGGAVSRRRRK